jgi:predicted dienelactone hydrolase
LEKKKQKTCGWLVLAVCSFALRAEAAGFQRAAVPDAGNPDLQVGIWYPSDTPTKPTALSLYTQKVATGGAVTGAHLPLIVMSHGQGGDFAGHVDTAVALADAGFVVAALTHTGDNLHDQSRVIDIQDRSRQLHVLTDWMLAHWPAHAQIDPARIGVFGFSAGGFTALVEAGGVPDTTRIDPHCAQYPAEFTCTLIASHTGAHGKLPPVPPADWIHDSRIKAAVVVAPALGFTFGREGLADVRVPVQLWRAERDHVLPNPFYAEAVRDALPTPPEYHVVAGMDHLDFLAPCDSAKAHYAPAVCVSAPGFDRAAVHRMFDAAVVRFFRASLAGR